MRATTLVIGIGILCFGCGNNPGGGPTSARGPGCSSDAECGLDEVCADGLCVRAIGQPLEPIAIVDGGAAVDGGRRDGGGPADGGSPDGGILTADGGAPVDGGGAADGGSVQDGGALTDGGAVDGGAVDGGADAGAPAFCSKCTTDAHCGPGLTCVTSERTGERFCSNACTFSSECPGTAICSFFLVDQGQYCIPPTGTCLEGRCNNNSCPSETPLCDSTSGRCYRTESRSACASCDYSFQCGGYWDRCLRIADNSKRCGRDCDSSRGGTCASGYRCAELTAPTGETIRQCVPLVGNCGGCRADNPCPSNKFCNIPTGECVTANDVALACAPCGENSDCGPINATCYQDGCMRYCDTFTPCAAGYVCRRIDDPQRGEVQRCLPNVDDGQSCEGLLFCARCGADNDCNGGLCVDLGGALGKRCSPHCDAVGNMCPSGSTCTSTRSTEACVPTACP
jgi:hypothetical protein